MHIMQQLWMDPLIILPIPSPIISIHPHLLPEPILIPIPYYILRIAYYAALEDCDYHPYRPTVTSLIRPSILVCVSYLY